MVGHTHTHAHTYTLLGSRAAGRVMTSLRQATPFLGGDTSRGKGSEGEGCPVGRRRQQAAAAERGPGAITLHYKDIKKKDILRF